MEEVDNSPNNNFDVLILGAGIAGLSAAHHLRQNRPQLKIAVVEAQDRYGGRIWTENLGEGHVELGAGWIHGATPENCVYQLATKFGLIPDHRDQRQSDLFDRRKGKFVNDSGIELDQDVCAALYDRLKVIEYQTTKLDHLDRRTLEQFIDDETESLKSDFDPNLVDSAIDYTKKYLQIHGGDCLDRMSAWGFGSYQEMAGGDIAIERTGGYRLLLDQLVREIGSDRLMLGSVVRQIDWQQPDMVKVLVDSSTRDGGSCLLRCRQVVVTFSVGSLQRLLQSDSNPELFVPSLPTDKVRAIESMGFGRVAKIYLWYRIPFWKRGTLNCLKFFSSSGQKSIPKEDDGDQPWYSSIGGFEEIATSSDVLLGWVTGPQAVQLEQLVYGSDDDSFDGGVGILKQNKDGATIVSQKCTQMLRQFTGNQSIPEPDRIVVSRWCTNPFVGGTYSYPSITTPDVNDFRLIGQSISDRLYFAGEATNWRYFSTVHGARESGLAAASDICEQYP